MGSIVQTIAITETVAAATLEFTGVTTAGGNLSQVAIAVTGTEPSGVSVADSGSNTWIEQIVSNSSSSTFYLFTTTNSSPTALSGGTVTITFIGGNVVAAARFWEISGVENTVPVDKSANNGSIGTAISSGATATLSASNELCFGASAIRSSFGGEDTFSTTSFTQGSPTTQWASSTAPDWSDYASGPGAELHSGYLTISTTTAQTWSDTSSGTHQNVGACWTLANSGSTPTPQPGLMMATL